MSRAADSDAELIRLCERTTAAIRRNMDLKEQAAKTVGAIPYPPGSPFGFSPGASKPWPSTKLRQLFQRDRSFLNKESRERRQAFIQEVVAYEQQCRNLEGAMDVRRAKQSCARSLDRARSLTDQVVDIEAQTAEGLARKAALIPAWLDAGFSLNDLDDLVMSIIHDARALGAGGASVTRYKMSPTLPGHAARKETASAPILMAAE